MRARRAAVVAALLGLIAVAGGCDLDPHGSAVKVPLGGARGWQRLGTVPLSPRLHPTVAVVGHRVVVMGGVQPERCPPHEFCPPPPEAHGGAVLDLRTGTWHPMRDIPHDAESGSVVVLGRWLVSETFASTEQLELYDPASDRWEQTPPDPSRTVGTAVAIGSRVYLVPVFRQPATVLDYYDARAGRWGQTPPIGLTSHQYQSSELVGDADHLFYTGEVRTGGHSAPWRTQVHELHHGSWTTFPESPVVAEGFVWDGRRLSGLHAVADAGEAGVSLDPTTGSWTRLRPPPIGDPYGISLASVNGGAGVASTKWVLSGSYYDTRSHSWRRVPRPFGLVGPELGGCWLGDRLLVVDDSGALWRSPRLA